MTQLIDLLAISLLMIVTGIFWGPWFALTRSFNVFTPGEFIKITKTLSTNLGPTMRFLLPGSILIMLAAVAILPDRDAMAFYLGIASVLSLITSLIITVAVEVPIVKTVEKWTPAALPTNWADLRDKWLRFHVARVIASLISFVCLAIALLQK